MWLINTADYSLVEVNHPEDYHYAILSHTWGMEGEVTFDDMSSLHVAEAKTAWHKVKWTCTLARRQRIGFAWIDTCCIDKRSSAELTEAINSMFGWYKKATICYTYLQDLREASNGDPESARARDQLRRRPGGLWTKRGTKESLQFDIAVITNIDKAILSNSEELSTVAVARKMSWAAKRQTTRGEDIAYSLLGIFDVNMPLIYGEGTKAFVRLQEAIAQSTNDLSLFAWSEDERNPRIESYYGVLAESPRQFVGCRQLESIEDPLRHDTQSFTMTNRGVEFQTLLKLDYINGDYLMPLYCKDSSVQHPEGRLGMISIRLVKTSTGFARYHASKVFVDDDGAKSFESISGNWDPFFSIGPHSQDRHSG